MRDLTSMNPRRPFRDAYFIISVSYVIFHPDIFGLPVYMIFILLILELYTRGISMMERKKRLFRVETRKWLIDMKKSYPGVRGISRKWPTLLKED